MLHNSSAGTHQQPRQAHLLWHLQPSPAAAAHSGVIRAGCARGDPGICRTGPHVCSWCVSASLHVSCNNCLWALLLLTGDKRSVPTLQDEEHIFVGSILTACAHASLTNSCHVDPPWQSRMSGSPQRLYRVRRSAGGEEGPRFQALPEPAPLPPLPRPTQPMSDAPAPAPMAGASAEYQVRACRSRHDSVGS